MQLSTTQCPCQLGPLRIQRPLRQLGRHPQAESRRPTFLYFRCQPSVP